MGSTPWVIGGFVAGGIIHILCVLGIPALAERDAWFRLSAAMKPNTLVVADGKSGVSLPFTTPDVITAYCLFDISDHNVIVRSPLSDGPWSLAVSTPAGENFYLVTGADAKKSEARLILIRRNRLSEESATEKTEEGEDQNIVVSPSDTGIIVIRAPLQGESFRTQALNELKKARCDIQPPEPVVAAVSEPPAPEVKSSVPDIQGRSRRHRTR
jgi:uncharacterized membrane protein